MTLTLIGRLGQWWFVPRWENQGQDSPSDLAQPAETFSGRAGNNAKIFGLKTYMILNMLDHPSVVLSGAGLILSIFLPFSFHLSVKRPARLWNVFPDLLIPYPQPLCLCEKLCVQNRGRCWALHVSLWPQQADGHKVGVWAVLPDFSECGELELVEHKASFLSINACGEIPIQKRNSLIQTVQ